MSGDEAVLYAHLAATLFMVGLIWFVQVVHYPLMAAVGEQQFVAYEDRHRTLTGVVVGPPMAVEGVATLLLFFAPPDGVGRTLPLVAGLVLAVVLGSTVLVQVPLHERLSRGFDAAAARRLVTTNWVRTIGWSTRGILAIVMLSRHLGA